MAATSSDSGGESKPETPPALSFEARLSAASRPATPAAEPLQTMPPEVLVQIATNDPAEYLKLKDQGHRLPKLSDL